MPSHSNPTKVLANLVPDDPQWIDLKGLLTSGRCDVWTEPDPKVGFVARSWDYPFAAVFGEPSSGLISEAVAAGLAAVRSQYLAGEWQLLAPQESRAVLEAALAGWRRRSVHLHRWEGKLQRPDLDVETRIDLLPDGHAALGLTFDHLPPTTRDEYTLEWVSQRPMAVALVDGLPASICYAAFSTQTLWDVSIETTKPHRRRGLAAATFLALARHMADQGLTPTWGAMEDNPGSLGLAARLGFVRDAELDGWSQDLSRTR